MKKILVYLLMILLFASPALSVDKYFLVGNALTGGVEGAVDSYNTTSVPDGSLFKVNTGTNVYNYLFNAASVAAEASPDIIKPDTGPGAWILTLINGEYKANSSATDQGDNGTVNSIKYLVDSIGSKEATIFLPYKSSSTTTAYTFDTSLDLSALPNINIRIENGARLERTTGDEVFTVYSPEHLRVGQRQIITEVDMVAFARGGTVYPDWWGASPVSSSDDTDPIQYAVNSIVAAVLGGTVYLQSGIYAVDDTIVVNNHYIWLKGDPKSTFIKRATGFTDNDTVRFSLDTHTNMIYCGVEGLIFTTDEAMSAGAHLKLEVCSQFEIKNCFFIDGRIGVHAESSRIRMNDSRIYTGSLYTAPLAFAYMYLDSDPLSSSLNVGWFKNCNFRSSEVGVFATHGIYISEGDGLWFNQCHFGNTESANMTIFPYDETTQLDGVNLNNCWFDKCNGFGLRFNGESSAPYTEFMIANCYFTGAGTAQGGILVEPSNVYPASTSLRNIQIRGGFIYQTTGNGISLDNCTNVNIEGVDIRSVGLTSGQGITMTDNATNVKVQNCSIGFLTNGTSTANSSYGIVLRGDGHTITNNDLRGNATGGIFNGSPTNTIIYNNHTDDTDTIASPVGGALTVPLGLDDIIVSGANAITSIVPTFKGHTLKITFSSTSALTDGSNLKLAGNFTGGADRTISLNCDGTNWTELSRSSN